MPRPPQHHPLVTVLAFATPQTSLKTSLMKTKRVGAYEAKTKLPALLKYVVEGNEVVITRRDKPVAKLVPFDTQSRDSTYFERLRALRGTIRLAEGETIKDLISAGRRF